MSQNYFQIDLPSGGRLNDGVDFSKIQIRPFTGSDESLLSEMNSNNRVSRLAMILGGTLRGVDILDLSMGDELYIMLWHAINSYSDGFQTDLICQTCLQKITIQYKLSDAKTIRLPSVFKEPHEVVLPSSGKKILCRIIRVRDSIHYSEYEREHTNSYLYRIASTIVDSSLDIVQKVSLLESMPAKDVAMIRSFQDSFYHGPDFRMNYVCSKCMGKGVFDAPFRFEHFFPYGDALTKNFRIKV